MGTAEVALKLKGRSGIGVDDVNEGTGHGEFPWELIWDGI